MKLSLKSIQAKENWAGYHLPSYDPAKIAENTALRPQWMHFGSGNIFRIFPAVLCQRLIEQKKMDTGIVSCEGYDDEIITKCFRPYNNLTIAVTLNADGRLEKEVVGSMSESLTMLHDSERIAEVFKEPSLQMVSFTITEKGYSLRTGAGELAPAVAQDMAEGPENCRSFMAQLTAMCLGRRKACGKPLALVSMDNCSHNGEKLQAAVTEIAEMWLKNGKITQEDFDYLQRDIAFPWSMIDKITPRPDEKVQKMLAEDGFEDNYTILTDKRTYTAPFVNAEETEYLVIEDNYTNGRPPLELGGVMYVDRETVDKVERMKVCTCLNPLHTAMSIYGCLLGYDLISAEMADEDIRGLITKLGHIEAMPVVVDPGVLKPGDFIDAVLNRRLPNPFMPDAPQRIATDTSQKLPIRFGETIKAYQAKGLNMDDLVLLPLVLAGYARYIRGIDDQGKEFEPSPDPLLEELRAIVAPLEVKEGEQDFSCLKELFGRKDVFGVDLYAAGLGRRIEGMAAELFAGPGAVRRTLHKYVSAR